MHAKWLSDMFVLGVPLGEKILRPIIVYFFLVIGLRLAGKRELAQLNPFDLVVLLTLSNTVQNAIIGNDNSLTGGIIGAATLLALNYLVVRFLYSHPNIDQIVEGQPCVLIENGKINEPQLAREILTREELAAVAHRQGIGNLEDVDRAVLEPSGTITFIAKKTHPAEVRHQDLVRRLDQLTKEIAQLRLQQTPPATPPAH